MNNFISRKIVYMNGQRLFINHDYTFNSDGFHFTFQVRGGTRFAVEHYVFGILVGVRNKDLKENWPQRNRPDGPVPGLKI